MNLAKIRDYLFYLVPLVVFIVGMIPQAASDPWMLTSFGILCTYLLLSGRLANINLRDPVLLLLLLLWLGWVWGCIFSNVPFASEVTLLVLATLPMSYLCASLNRQRDMMKLLKAICLIMTGLATAAIVEVLPPHGHWRAGLFFDDQNTLGAMIALVIPLSLSFYFSEENRKIKIFIYACLMLLAGGLIATQSRSALLGCLVGTAIVFYKFKPALTQRSWKIILPLAVIAISLLFVTDFSDRILRNLAHDKDVMGRIAIWQSALKMAMISPLHGVGLGIFHLHYPHYKTINDNSAGIWVHMDALQWAVETGWATLAIFYALAGFILVKCWREKLTPVQTGAAASLLTIFIISHAGFAFHVIPILLLTGLLLAQFPPTDIVPLTRARYIVSVSLVIVLLCGIVSLTRDVPAIYFWNRSMKSYYGGNPTDFTASMQTCLEKTDPRFPGCELDGARILIQNSSNPPPETLVWLDEAQKANPMGAESDYLRAQYSLKKYPKNPEVAISFLRKSLEINPTFWMSRKQLVLLLANQGKYKAAYDALEGQRHYWLEGQIYLDVNAMEKELMERLNQ